MNRKLPGGILAAVKRPRGGARTEHLKLTREMPCERVHEPDTVVLPMSQHIGAPCKPTVKVGDHVDVGQVIGDADAFVSAPIHASVSGKVKSIGEVLTANGSRLPAVTIENDGANTLFAGIEPPKVTNREELLKAVRASGLVGLGGAGFPSHVKLGFDPAKNVDTLIINAAECEPYITVDYRECMDNTDDIITGIHLLMRLLGFKRTVIAIESDKPAAIRLLNERTRNDHNISIMALLARYPQGAEKLMVLSATGRVVPEGKLPADVGCVVMNVTSCAFVARYLATGKPLVSRSLTVSGDAIKTPKNLRAPIGISVDDLINTCGGFRVEPAKIIAGGPMMGTALYDTSVPILKSNNAILALSAEKAGLKPERACIHCGRCADVCPMHLIPTDLEKMALRGDAKALTDAGIGVCMECGSCAWSCPAGKPLVQYMRLGKQVVREAGAKK